MENILNDWVDSVAVKDYLDAVVASKNLELKLEKFGDRIELAAINEHVHVFRGIHEMAAAVEATIKEEFRKKQTRYPYEYSFVYNGVKFIQLSEGRMK